MALLAWRWALLAKLQACPARLRAWRARCFALRAGRFGSGCTAVRLACGVQRSAPKDRSLAFKATDAMYPCPFSLRTNLFALCASSGASCASLLMLARKAFCLTLGIQRAERGHREACACRSEACEPCKGRGSSGAHWGCRRRKGSDDRPTRSTPRVTRHPRSAQTSANSTRFRPLFLAAYNRPSALARSSSSDVVGL